MFWFVFRAAIKMRDQCGVIFRQAKKELEASGLLNNEKEVLTQKSTGGEESMASDIDKELENLQVNTLLINVFNLSKKRYTTLFNFLTVILMKY